MKSSPLNTMTSRHTVDEYSRKAERLSNRCHGREKRRRQRTKCWNM